MMLVRSLRSLGMKKPGVLQRAHSRICVQEHPAGVSSRGAPCADDGVPHDSTARSFSDLADQIERGLE
ncbi:MAG TPA: hypothetical protein VLC09_21035, partial [Polyangiaceae bacterium]|nr:hypothetical protein [Polyangiaceae bacterium]